MSTKSRWRRYRGRALTVLAILAIGAAVVVGLVDAPRPGGGADRPAPTGKEAMKLLAGSPPALARLHSQANRLLPGGRSAFTARLEALRGHPVVVNKWASWCAPCRAEFPELQRAALEYGKRVAFLGVNSDDDRGDAARFLKRYPVTYPSYSDPRSAIAHSLNPATIFPTTIFYDSAGRLQYVHDGQYLTLADLRKDIELYALGAGAAARDD